VARLFASGSADRIDCGTAAVLQQNTFTYAAWVKWTSFVGGWIVAKRDANGNGKNFLDDQGSLARLKFSVDCATTVANVESANSTLTAGTWYFVACTYTTADKIPHIYLGTQTTDVAELTGGSLAVGPTTGVGAEVELGGGNAGNWMIAARNTGGGGPIDAAIESVYAFNVVLTVPELVALQRRKLVRPEACLGAWDMAFGLTTIPDKSGQGHPGTATGSTVVTGPGGGFVHPWSASAIHVLPSPAAPPPSTGVPNSLAMMGVGV